MNRAVDATFPPVSGQKLVARTSPGRVRYVLGYYRARCPVV